MESAETSDSQSSLNNDVGSIHLAIGRASVYCGLVLLASCVVKILGNSLDAVTPFGPWISFLVPPTAIAFDAGAAILMVHCFFLFPTDVPNRFVPAVVALAITGLQLLFVSSDLLAPFAAYAFSSTIVGWFLQRSVGLCFSLAGESVHQRPLSVGVYVALPAMLVLIGIVPACMTLAFFPGGNMNLALLTVNHALGMLVLCTAPLSFLYLLLWMVHLRLETKLAVSFALFIVLTVLFGLMWTLQMVSLYLALLLLPAAFVGGVLTIYACFFLCGFRVVWAKRLVLSDAHQVVGFDDLD